MALINVRVLARTHARRFRLVVTLACVSFVASCTPERIAVASLADPMVYVVLNQDPGFVSTPRGGQRAYVVDVGNPVITRYRVAERFEMRRVRDSGLFAWASTGKAGLLRFGISSLRDGNYQLAALAGGGVLGGADIVNGERYTLDITTNNVAIHGSVFVPAAFQITYVVRGTERLLVWPRVAGAAQYSVIGSSPMFLGESGYQSDTSFVIPNSITTAEDFTVAALDTNLYRYAVEENRARSGIDAGYGVFGAISTANISVPARAALRARGN